MIPTETVDCPIPPGPGTRRPPPAGSRVHVLGLGKSGVAAALLASRLGCKVSATDVKGREAIGAAAELEEAGVRLDLGGHDPSLFRGADLVVVSPGVPDSDLLREAVRSGSEVVAEVELAWRCSRASFVGVTGSNGKSTVTTMIGAIVSKSPIPAWTGGNLGTPLCSAVGGPADCTGGVFVVELSSFQLERVPTLCCSVAALLNITPDHLDRYPDLESYAAAKSNIFAGQTSHDHAIVPAGEPESLSRARRSRATVHVVGAPGSEIFEQEGVIRIDGIAGASGRICAADLGLHDPLAVSNGIVAIASALLAGAGLDAVVAGMRDFSPLPHRFQLVAEHGGVAWVNDSKATNPASVVAALRAVRGGVILIAGGLDKHLDYESIVPEACGKVRLALLIGQASGAIAGAIGRSVETREVGTLSAAIDIAAGIARPGETVLLSPACASFDQFRNFEHRGEEFARLVLSKLSGV